jgi:hypothetical protein
MLRRVAAAQATLDRFRDAPFAFGEADCARLVGFHLRQLGYRPGLSRGGSYRTALGARAALRRAGFASLGAWLDDVGLVRIAPAEALVGDILQGESGDEFAALGVALGNLAMVGFHEDAAGATVLRSVRLSGAWRAVPL